MSNSGIAESYVNKVCINAPTAERWWATPNILVGGSIVDEDDWQHLKKTYGIDAVINVETEHDDYSFSIDKLLQIRVNDDGGVFPNTYIHQLVAFVNYVGLDKTYYVHCQMGGSRSPAFVYGILRGCYNYTPVAALSKINETKLWGNHMYHHNYINSVEEGLANSNIAEFYHNTYSNVHYMTRYWVTAWPTHPSVKILVGGNITNNEDWVHLQKDFNIGAVINVDGNTDSGKGIENLAECYVLDNGDPFPENLILKAILFADKHKDKILHIHCHAGISRSTHFTYAILRALYSMSPDQAEAAVVKALPSSHHLGFYSHHDSYTKSIEAALYSYWAIKGPTGPYSP